MNSARKILLLALAVFLAAGCSKKKTGGPGGPGGKRGPMKFPVEVQAVKSERLEYTITAIGQVDAFERIQITARVAGVIEKVDFQEGSVVKPRQLLASIEPSRYGIAVQSAKAQLERAQAALADAEAGLKRREDAVQKNPGLIAGEDVESWRTRGRTAAAEVAAARAMLNKAALDLRDAHVRAPVGGRIDTRNVQTGQYAQPGTVLATLVQRDPLLLRFQVPESDAQRLSPGLTASFRVREDPRVLSATIKHLGGQANEASRMVQVVAEITDPAREQLTPGTFAEVEVAIGAPVEAAVIPQTAVRPSEKGFIAFVVENEIAKERVLTLGMRTAKGLVEVKSGLAPGDQLVIRGGEALRDGAGVRLGGAGPGGKPGGKPGGPGGPGAGAGPAGKPGTGVDAGSS